MSDEVVAIPPEPELTAPEALEVLRHGEIEVLGRLAWSSNTTLLVTVRADGVEMPAVYKPRRGERPLWDFPDGSLCEREVATYELSAALDWSIVPETVLRDGPHGDGMVQRFVEHDPDEHYFALVEEHHEMLRLFAVFDVLANNADRKGGHVLRSLRTGALLGIDHGLTFHAQWKLRTVIWDFGGERIEPWMADAICRFVTDLEGSLAATFEPLLSRFELESLRARARELVREGKLPTPEPGYHSVPWPMV
jgi:uncharacterized repeat protein (TIGR03843 family)